VCVKLAWTTRLHPAPASMVYQKMLKLFISLNEGLVTIPKLNLPIVQKAKIHVTLLLLMDTLLQAPLMRSVTSGCAVGVK
jgi:hypothetical protein